MLTVLSFVIAYTAVTVTECAIYCHVISILAFRILPLAAAINTNGVLAQSGYQVPDGLSANGSVAFNK